MDTDTDTDTETDNRHEGQEQQANTGTGNPVVQGLSDTAQTLGASVQAMQQVLLGNMRQAAQMTLSMNQMMEELVKRAIHVSVVSQPSQQMGSCTLLLKVTNRSPIPLSQLTTKLWFIQHQHEDQDARVLTVKCIDDPDLEKTSLLGGYVEKSLLLAGEAVEEQPFISGSRQTALASGLASESSVVVETEWPVQITGKIAVEFASPGTGSTLAVSHRFGVHIWQLMPCSYQDAKPSSNIIVDGSAPVSISIEHARSIFKVPPTSGVAIGALFKMGSGNEYLALRVESISEDSGTAQCVWLSSSNGSRNTRLCSLVPALSEELLSLCK
ncbi:hypothetical protein J3B02_000009 [Coemansia erecta]|nr:hypothetical protein J3B02_000009 [Coemansia erecta]KAJ2887488.1 hypothetical protein FB639_001280 [Coemansia asiatica]